MATPGGSHLPDGGKARRAYLQLRDEITRGTHAPGAILPGETRLAQKCGVSRVTIRRALDALAADGLIEKRLGAGSLVRDPGAQAVPLSGDLASLMPQLVEIGQRTEARLLSFGYGHPPQPVATALGLDAGARVQTAERVRLIGGTPFSHLTTHVPEAIAANYSEADLATTPLFRLLERSGVQIDGAHQSVTAALATPEVARALNVAVGSALLSLTRVVRDAAGGGVEYLSALYRPDLYRLDMDLCRVGSDGDRHWQPVIGAPPSAEAAE
ncbi:GntR family transcriptional regulator [Tropicimonas sp. S265A]|uniref:GntR family transcriptional regulator n=1 Tax=Tropicimonas sp. S265A TaxID=3415134 RepID=UPI003C7BF71F